MEKGKLLFQERNRIFLFRKYGTLLTGIITLFLYLIVISIERIPSDNRIDRFLAIYFILPFISFLIILMGIRISKVKIYERGLTIARKPYRQILKKEYFMPFENLHNINIGNKYMMIVRKNGKSYSLTSADIGDKSYSKVREIIIYLSNKYNIHIGEIKRYQNRNL